MGWKTLDDMDLNGKRVLVRVDINVPLLEGVVTDSTRIRRIAPSVRDILEAGGRPILLAHFWPPQRRAAREPVVEAADPNLGACL